MESVGHTIWLSARNLSHAGVEIDAIIKALQDKLENSGIGFQLVQTDNLEDSYALNAHCFSGTIASTSQRKRKPQGYLTYSFSLWRDKDDAGDGWPEARQAKIYVGYATFDVGSWDNDDLFLDGDASNPAVTHLRGKNSSLWGWSEDENFNTEPWNSRSWFYVVPLGKINSQRDIDVNLVAPVVELLTNEQANPDEVLGKTSALVFKG